MTNPSPEQIADIILNRRTVYDLDTDSRIREASNRLTARLLFELLARLDGHPADPATELTELLHKFPNEGPSYSIGFHSGASSSAESQPRDHQIPGAPSEHYLRLVFRDEQAAFYQFHLFPDLDADYVSGAARKRAGAVQHLRIVLTNSDALQAFLKACHRNPHLLRVEESTADEFDRAPSNGV